MNAYVIYLDQRETESTSRWTIFTVTNVSSIKHDDRTASLYSITANNESQLVGVVRLSENVSVILSEEPPQLGGITETPARIAPLRPSINKLSPANGRLIGGTQVDIHGENLIDASNVFFGTAPAQAFTLLSPDGPIRATSPAGVGAVHVTVVTSAGSSALTAADQFQYQDPLPIRIHVIDPPTAVSTGGETVVVVVQAPSSAGSPPDVSAFLFGSAATKSFGYNSDYPTGVAERFAFNVTTPPNSPGNVLVSCLTNAGVSSPGSSFTYTAAMGPKPPAIASLSVQDGPIIGGTLVQIEGTGLAEATDVLFGGVPSESFHVKLKEQNIIALEATAPPGKGSQHVTVITPHGSSPIVDESHFVYHVPTVLSTISFLDQSVGSNSTVKSVTLPLQVSLRDLPPDQVVVCPGDSPMLVAALQLGGLGPQFTVGQFIAAYGDITANYALAGLRLDRGIGRDFTLQFDGTANISVAFSPIKNGYRADVVRATIGGLAISGTGLAASLAAAIAPLFAATLNNYLSVLVEGNGT
jgi:hypothetical protein